jgi:hypothetical protein
MSGEVQKPAFLLALKTDTKDATVKRAELLESKKFINSVYYPDIQILFIVQNMYKYFPKKVYNPIY